MSFCLLFKGGSCNFEKDTCFWTNTQKGDDFDWLRSRGGTSSSLTGPSVDHTTSTAKGYYMYIETSAPRVKGDKARLFSQVYPPTSDTRCFTFYYDMNGADTGSLNVYVLLNESSITFTTESIMWSLQGDQSNQWSMGQFYLSSQYTSAPYQVLYFHCSVNPLNAG